MDTFVNGVRITLTAAQVAAVEKELGSREKCKNDFAKMLKKFGFKKIDTSTWTNPNMICFEHSYYNWFAEINDHGAWSELWMVGTGLKCGGFPGGWMYSEPEQVEEEIVKFLDKYEP